MLLALRINVLAKGHSGIAPGTLRQLIDAFNASCLPWVPEQGTVGASGDLAPLSHLGFTQIEPNLDMLIKPKIKAKNNDQLKFY